MEKLLHQPEVETFLQGKIGKSSSALEEVVARIALSRLQHPRVFRNYTKYLDNLRERVEEEYAPRYRGLRHGRVGAYFDGLRFFCDCARTDDGRDPRESRPAEKAYAARMALVEHAFKLWHNASLFEQHQALLAVRQYWDARVFPNAAMLDGEQVANTISPKKLILRVYRNKKRPVAVRALQLLRHFERLHETAKARKTILQVLKDNKVDTIRQYYRTVNRSLFFLSKQAPDKEFFKDIDSEHYWKQRMINKVAGLPPPEGPPPEDYRDPTTPQKLRETAEGPNTDFSSENGKIGIGPEGSDSVEVQPGGDTNNEE